VQLRQQTGCLIAGHRDYVHWHEDPERHYQEWARTVPALIPDTPELRASVFDWFDSPHSIDLFVDEGTVFDLGGGVTLEGFRFPGHMRNDLGWFEGKSRTLILGDGITATEWPHFHIHETVPGYRSTLARLPGFLRDRGVGVVFMTHFGPVPASEALVMVQKSIAFLDKIDRTLLRVVATGDAVSLREIWHAVATQVGKAVDHMALTSINAHVQEFLARGLIREVEPLVYALR
jgi:glyoxylase-like metal-dependent hydrolase (beta-lactamase superfamily II)